MTKDDDTKAVYFFGGMCAGIAVCYIVLWLALHV